MPTGLASALCSHRPSVVVSGPLLLSLQVNFRALVLSYLLLNHWAQEVCTQGMFLNYEPELEPRSLTPGRGFRLCLHPHGVTLWVRTATR